MKSREKTTLDIGTRIILESEKLLSQTHHNQISCNDNVNEKYQAMFLAGIRINTLSENYLNNAIHYRSWY